MYVPILALVVAVLFALGAIQGASAIALRSYAAPVSLPRAAPEPLVRLVENIDAAAPLPQVLRRVLAAAALERGDVARAAAYVRAVKPGPDRDVLNGAIAERSGDETRAVADYLAAGDLASLERRVDALVRAHDVRAALRLQDAVLTRLVANRAQTDTLAEATYREGLVLQEQAYTFAPSDPRRRPWELRSRDAYARAARFAPLEERYVLALANQSLNISDLARARTLFARVRELDPASVEPLTGLADAALRAHDIAGARAYLAAARRLAPDAPAIARLAAQLPPS